jgi:curved DNA-binding protein CbpA
MKNPYETLNFAKDADEKEIKNAYKKKAKEHHPDVGGNEKEFKEAAAAYALLICPQKRAYFDEHGHEMPNQDNVLSRAMTVLDEMFTQILSSFSPKELLHRDFISEMKKALHVNLNKVNSEISEHKKAILNVTEYRNLFTAKLYHKKSKLQQDFFQKNLDGKEQGIITAMANLDNKKQVIEKALEILSDYDFHYEKKEEVNQLNDLQKMVQQMQQKGPLWFGYDPSR